MKQAVNVLFSVSASLMAFSSFGATPAYRCELIASNLESGQVRRFPSVNVPLVRDDEVSNSLTVRIGVKAFLSFRKWEATAEQPLQYSLGLEISRLDAKGHPVQSLQFSQANVDQPTKKFMVGGCGVDKKTCYTLSCVDQSE